MDASVIHQKLDLLIRLIDTTTGAVVEEKNVRFFKNGEAVRPIRRGSGNYVFLNTGRKDVILEVHVYGYEPCYVTICYERLDHQMPIQEVFLIPSENAIHGQPVLTLSGTLPGLVSIQTVSLYATCGCVSGFEERKRILKLFGTHGSGLDGIYYGLIHLEEQTYEPFTIIKEISKDAIKIENSLKEPFSVNAPISRVIFGSVTEEGRYCIRVRDESEHHRHLVRYVVGEEVRYQMVDFHNLTQELL